MGLLDLFKGKSNDTSSRKVSFAPTEISRTPEYADSSMITLDEKPYYQPDEYYTFVTHKGTPFEHRVVTFDQRCKETYPSKQGLYVPEILLLEYCNYGTYPKPSNGYPGFWWFQYGIRDVGGALKSLERRGFIEWGSKASALEKLKVPELKEILVNANLPSGGKKAELVERVKAMIPETDWPDMGESSKYVLTNKGRAELEANEYVPYMHKHCHKTIENNTFGETFTVWDMNKLIAKDGRQSDWRNIIGEIEEKRFGVNTASSYSNQNKTGFTNKHIELEPGAKDDMRAFLNSQRKQILEASKAGGDGFDEESKGIDYRRIGDDKAALVQFYISIEKKFDAPALYRETAVLLEKYGLYEEELEVLKKGLVCVPSTNKHWAELEKLEKKVKITLESAQR